MMRSEFYTLFGFAAAEDRIKAQLNRRLVVSNRAGSMLAAAFGGLVMFGLLQFDVSSETRFLKLVKLSVVGLSPFWVNGALRELLEYSAINKQHSWNLQMVLISRITNNILSQAYRKPRVEACQAEETLELVQLAIESMEEHLEIQQSDVVNEKLAEYLTVVAKHYSGLPSAGLSKVFKQLLLHADDKFIPQVYVSMRRLGLISCIETTDHVSTPDYRTRLLACFV